MKIGIVNSLPAAVEAIRRALESTSRYQVLWVAEDGAEAVEKRTKSEIAGQPTPPSGPVLRAAR